MLAITYGGDWHDWRTRLSTGWTHFMTMPRWTVERWLLILTCITSVLGFTFGLGVSWATMVAERAQIDALVQGLDELS